MSLFHCWPVPFRALSPKNRENKKANTEHIFFGIFAALGAAILALVILSSADEMFAGMMDRAIRELQKIDGIFIAKLFLAFGAKRTVYEPNSAGEILKKKYVDFTAVTDERIVDGQYYASAFKKIRSCLLHPEQLDEHPEVKEDIY